jgi:hypothetical protein
VFYNCEGKCGVKMESTLLNKTKKVNSRFDFYHSKKLLKSKRSQGVFGMSFGMIFSIILIIFIVAAAFVAIKFFLDFQRSSSIGLFLEDFQGKVDEAWKSSSGDFLFEKNLPSGLEYICFINMSAPAFGSSSIEKEIYNEVRFGDLESNFVLYPPEKAGSLSHKRIEHFKLPDTNPYCVEVVKGEVSIRIMKSFNEALPRVS